MGTFMKFAAIPHFSFPSKPLNCTLKNNNQSGKQHFQDWATMYRERGSRKASATCRSPPMTQTPGDPFRILPSPAYRRLLIIADLCWPLPPVADATQNLSTFANPCRPLLSQCVLKFSVSQRNGRGLNHMHFTKCTRKLCRWIILCWFIS